MMNHMDPLATRRIACDTWWRGRGSPMAKRPHKFVPSISTHHITHDKQEQNGTNGQRTMEKEQKYSPTQFHSVPRKMQS